MVKIETVGELIALLQHLNPAAKVWVEDGEWGLLEPKEIRCVVSRDRPSLGSTVRTGARPASRDDLNVAIVSIA